MKTLTLEVEIAIDGTNSSTDAWAIEKLSRKEKMDRIRELLNFALEKVEWVEIKEGRRDDAARNL